MLLEVNCFQTQYVYCEGTILPLHYYPTIIVSRYPAAGKYFQNTTYPQSEIIQEFPPKNSSSPPFNCRSLLRNVKRYQL